MILGVLSGKGGVGKTSVSANLAIALAGLKRKTLLIDGDLGNPNLDKVLGIKGGPENLSDILKGKAFRDEAVLKGFQNNLDVIPSKLGLKEYYEADLLRFVELVRPLGKEYDLVIVDGPAGIDKTMLVVLRLSDEVVIVTNPNPSSLVDGLKLKKIMDALGVPLRGVIVNKVPRNMGRGFLKQIELHFSAPILGVVPDTDRAEECFRRKLPILLEYPNNAFSSEITRVAQLVAADRRLPVERKRCAKGRAG